MAVGDGSSDCFISDQSGSEEKINQTNQLQRSPNKKPYEWSHGILNFSSYIGLIGSVIAFIYFSLVKYNELEKMSKGYSAVAKQAEELQSIYLANGFIYLFGGIVTFCFLRLFLAMFRQSIWGNHVDDEY